VRKDYYCIIDFIDATIYRDEQDNILLFATQEQAEGYVMLNGDMCTWAEVCQVNEYCGFTERDDVVFVSQDYAAEWDAEIRRFEEKVL
jgi:hypothetical protein